MARCCIAWYRHVYDVDYTIISKTLDAGPAYPCYAPRQVDPEGTFVSGMHIRFNYNTS